MSRRWAGVSHTASRGMHIFSHLLGLFQKFMQRFVFVWIPMSGCWFFFSLEIGGGQRTLYSSSFFLLSLFYGLALDD